MNNTTEEVLLNFSNWTLLKVLDDNHEEDSSAISPLAYILPSVCLLAFAILIVLSLSYRLMEPKKQLWSCCCLKCCRPSSNPLLFTYKPGVDKEGPTFWVKSTDPYRTASTAVDALPQTIQGPIFPAPDIFYDIDLNPKEEEVDGITRQESLTQRCAKIIQARVESLRKSSSLNQTSLTNDNFRLGTEDIDMTRKAWARDSFDPKLLQNEPGLLKVRQGDSLTILKDGITTGYTQVMNSQGETGFVPTTILQF